MFRWVCGFGANIDLHDVSEAPKNLTSCHPTARVPKPAFFLRLNRPWLPFDCFVWVKECQVQVWFSMGLVILSFIKSSWLWLETDSCWNKIDVKTWNKWTHCVFLHVVLNVFSPPKTRDLLLSKVLYTLCWNCWQISLFSQPHSISCSHECSDKLPLFFRRQTQIKSDHYYLQLRVFAEPEVILRYSNGTFGFCVSVRWEKLRWKPTDVQR